MSLHDSLAMHDTNLNDHRSVLAGQGSVQAARRGRRACVSNHIDDRVLLVTFMKWPYRPCLDCLRGASRAKRFLVGFSANRICYNIFTSYTIKIGVERCPKLLMLPCWILLEYV